MSLRLLVFSVVVVGVLGGLTWWVQRRIACILGAGTWGRRSLAGLLWGGLCLALVGRGVGRWIGPGEPPIVRAATLLGGAVVTGVLVTAGLLLLWEGGCLGFQGVRGLWRRARRSEAVRPAGVGASRAVAVGDAEAVPPASADRSRGGGRPEGGEVLDRRAFLQRTAQGALVATGMGLGLWGTTVGRLDFRVETLLVPLPGLPPTLDGYTLLQVSDVHVGTFVGEPELRAALQVASGVRPDLVVLTGDLVDHDPAFAPMMARFVRRLGELARDGVVSVPGNHDYYTGIEDVVVAQRAAGARVLLDDAWLLGEPGRGLVLLGVDDLWSARWRRGRGPDLDRALSRVRGASDMPRVLLAHNPAFFPQAAGRVHLQLSGHTHGGQINVGSRLPAEVLLPHGYVAGRYERSGSLLYVNRGLGTAGPPARVGSPPELTRVVLLAG